MHMYVQHGQPAKRHSRVIASQAATRASLILLLFGTIVGDFALLADVGTRALQRLHTAHVAAPAWLTGHRGRLVMVLLAICPVYPLCCLRKCVPLCSLPALPARSASAAACSARLHVCGRWHALWDMRVETHIIPPSVGTYVL